jgi:hypothetical protein
VTVAHIEFILGNFSVQWAIVSLSFLNFQTITPESSSPNDVASHVQKDGASWRIKNNIREDETRIVRGDAF